MEIGSATTWPDTVMCLGAVAGIVAIVYIVAKHTSLFKG